MDAGVACHAITWRLTLGQSGTGPAPWSLTAIYRVPPPSNPNLMVDGPRVAIKGTWTTTKGTTHYGPAAVYRLTSDARRAVSFVRISEELVHMLAR